MAIVSAANLKGGVGKTSTVVHAAGTLSQLGKRVLIVDNDPQASATAGFLGAQAARQLPPSATIAAIHSGDDPFPEQVIRPAGFERIELLPGSRFAADFNTPAAHKAPYEDQVRLRDFLAGIRDRYDVVLIDNPPNLHLATWSSLAASDYYLVPVQPEDFGSQGTVDVDRERRSGPAPDQSAADPARLRHHDVREPPGRPPALRGAAPDHLCRAGLRGGRARVDRLHRGHRRASAGRVPQAARGARRRRSAVVEELLERIDRTEAERAGEAA